MSVCAEGFSGYQQELARYVKWLEGAAGPKEQQEDEERRMRELLRAAGLAK